MHFQKKFSVHLRANRSKVDARFSKWTHENDTFREKKLWWPPWIGPMVTKESNLESDQHVSSNCFFDCMFEKNLNHEEILSSTTSRKNFFDFFHQFLNILFKFRWRTGPDRSGPQRLLGRSGPVRTGPRSGPVRLHPYLSSFCLLLIQIQLIWKLRPNATQTCSLPVMWTFSLNLLLKNVAPCHETGTCESVR